MKEDDMEIMVFKPSVDVYTNNEKRLKECFLNRPLADKTVCEDRIVYVFGAPYKKA